MDTQTYAANYAKLRDVAATLRKGDTDIDALVPKVEEAVAAFKACKERIKAVAQSLNQALPPELEKL